MQLCEGDVAAALWQCEDSVGAALQQRWGAALQQRWGGAGAAWKLREGSIGAAWWGREGCVSAGCYCVGAAWELCGGCVGAVQGWHWSDARAAACAPEVRVKGCTS